MSKLFAVILTVFSFSCFAREIPLEDFFKNPNKLNVQISPNGEFLSYLEPWENRLNIFVKNLKTNEIKQVTHVSHRDIHPYLWVSDDRIVFLQDKEGDENYHLFTIHHDGSEILDLTPFEGVTCSIIDKLENEEGKILIQMNRRNPEIFDVYLLDIDSGEMKNIAENPGDVTHWLVDNEGKLRAAEFTDGVNTGIRYRETENDEWQTIATYNYKEKATPLFFTFDDKNIYVASNVGRDKSAIFEYDLLTGTETTCIFEHPDVDVYHLIKSKKNKKIIGVAYVTDKDQIAFFEDLYEKMQKFINEKLPNYEIYLSSSDKDETKFIIYSANDRTPGSYHLFDLEKWELTKLFDVSPWINKNELAEMKPISYTSRDGLTIHGYLTLPKDKEAKNLPIVVIPHGGPCHRDNWFFSPTVQFLANRGFAVLQMNFRGSTGYGKKFWEAGFKQWGLAMQDDITDGVLWAIDQGIADPNKIAIYGGSYGGYAALSGITQTPDLYAAAVDYVGVANLFTFLDTIPPYWMPFREMMFEMIGHPERDKEQFLATSPCLNAHKIKTPLFIAQGANDPRVNKAESDQMVASLQKRDITVEYMVKDNEGHGFHNEENRFDFYRAMEQFLKKHLDSE